MDALKARFDISRCKKVCRLCLAADGSGMKTLFPKNRTTGKNEALLGLIFELTTIHMEPVKDLESQICSNCLKKVNDFNFFRQKCIESEETLQSQLQQQQEDEDENLMIEIEPDLFDITPDFEEPGSSNEDNMDRSNGGDCSFLDNHPEKIDVRNTIIYVDNQKLYQCPFCEKTFSQSGNLKAHINTHTGFKPYCCQICMRAFAQKSNLNYHTRTAHNPNRPFKCNHCEKTFKSKDDLGTHIKNKHDVITEFDDDGIKLVKFTKKGRSSSKKLHGCPYCGKCFAQSFNMKLHINTHTGEKPYQCSLCDKAFAQKSNLNVHINKNHRSDVIKTEVDEADDAERITDDYPEDADVAEDDAEVAENYAEVAEDDAEVAENYAEVAEYDAEAAPQDEEDEDEVVVVA